MAIISAIVMAMAYLAVGYSVSAYSMTGLLSVNGVCGNGVAVAANVYNEKLKHVSNGQLFNLCQWRNEKA